MSFPARPPRTPGLMARCESRLALEGPCTTCPPALHASPTSFEQLVHIRVGNRVTLRRVTPIALRADPVRAPAPSGTSPARAGSPSRPRRWTLELRAFADDPATQRASAFPERFAFELLGRLERSFGRRSVPRSVAGLPHSRRSSALRSRREDSTGPRSGPAKSRRRTFVASDPPRVACAASSGLVSHARPLPAQPLSGLRPS